MEYENSFDMYPCLYTKKAIRHGQPISIVNLKSNTMKNTVQI